MKKNKGFSMVELIIVIAIMAILAGALAPALIKYINKSRISTDIQTGNTIATAVQTALSNEAGYDEAAQNYDKQWTKLTGGSPWGTDDFMATVGGTVGDKIPKVKSKKCLKSTGTAGDFEIYVDTAGNVVKVRIGGDHLVFPTADECLTNDNATACSASASGN